MSKHADYIRRVVDAAPPLTPEQYDKLAVLLLRSDAPHREGFKLSAAEPLRIKR